MEYAVSRGNGNDGVSRMYPDYVVTTDEPYLLARLAAVSEFKPGYGRRWCRDRMQVDGEAEYGISTTIYDPPGRDGAGYSDHNGAWRIWEVYPADQVSDRSEAPRFDSLEGAFGAALVRAARKREAA
jgi:hypothetical protein